jgi:hypothetical protein
MQCTKLGDTLYLRLELRYYFRLCHINLLRYLAMCCHSLSQMTYLSQSSQSLATCNRESVTQVTEQSSLR